MYLARAASTFASCAASESLRSTGSSRMRICPLWTRCPMLTDRSRIFPPTRKPKSLCTRASTIPVKVLPFEPAALALKISTRGDCRRGSFTTGLEHPPVIKAIVSHVASSAKPINGRRPPGAGFRGGNAVGEDGWNGVFMNASGCGLRVHDACENGLMQPARRGPDEHRHELVRQAGHDAHAPGVKRLDPCPDNRTGFHHQQLQL